MPLARGTITLAHSSALSEHALTNTFHFTTQDDAPATFNLLLAAMKAFYDGGATPLYTFMSSEVAQNGHERTVYNLDEPTPRIPVAHSVWNFPVAPNGDPLPGEVACCVSFQGAAASGVNQARQRGRLFIGRLDKDCASGGRPTAALRTALKDAALALKAASDLAVEWSWVVYSPTAAAQGDPTPFALVDNGWIDDAFDTQRRRGLDPTTRTLW